MKSSTTIITAYFDIGRGDWTANKGFREKLARSVDVYFSYFERLAALENEMIIFTSPDLKPRVEAIRNGKPTTVIFIEIKTVLYTHLTLPTTNQGKNSGAPV
ncbi:WlaTC/HtrL family glycosyltransferase, partial [Escherichia coli]|uniref:WlaTC/HtrL family glycosyltransferase n=1 Tax=Escherichia coli TaxID=562 RepID=UPI0024E26F7E